MKRGRRWSVKRLRRECASAPVVYLALDEMAAKQGSAVVTPTRLDLCAATGLNRKPTISEALTALEKAKWIRRSVVKVPASGGVKTVLRITLLYGLRSALPIRASGVTRSVTLGASPGLRSALPDSSLKRRGARPTAPAPSSGRERPRAQKTPRPEPGPWLNEPEDGLPGEPIKITELLAKREEPTAGGVA